MELHDLVDLSPIAQLLLVGAVLATLALLPAWLRHRHAAPAVRLRAVGLVTLFLTFDLVLFGAFTRLTDSGLGCPDWPGCYGNASPAGAHAEIQQAQTSMPTGPVTHGKAWVEMVHRYLATGVGVLITWTLVRSAWLRRRSRGGGGDPGTDAGLSPGWAALCFIWVCLQGLFGALTVTMKLYPAIVTLHLAGGIGLLALLAVQRQRQRPATAGTALPPGVRLGAWVVFALVIVQMLLGGWVSTNYAVLACSDFPTCQGRWWPQADYANGFTLLRALSHQADGQLLRFDALVAIHWAHRLGAAVVLLALALFSASLQRLGTRTAQRHARALAGLAAWQLATGLGNVLLGWPLAAAVAHTGGAAALVAVLAHLLAYRPARLATVPVAGAPVLPPGPTAVAPARS
ncbi:MAG: COX15/CtaA family protein [Burkholderiales bacterium]